MPENASAHQDRLSTLRKEIERLGMDGLIIARTDEFQGEFLAPYAERLAWLTGFSGSAGLAVILKDNAVVMSDGRYTLQLQEQIDRDIFEAADNTQTSIAQWLKDRAQTNGKDMKIGYDAWLHTAGQIKKIEDGLKEEGIRHISLQALYENPIDAVWRHRPAKPNATVTIFPHDVAGKTSIEKRTAIAQKLDQNGCDACLITLGDSICWLLNIRGSDIDYSPLPLSYAILHKSGALDWFIAPDKVSEHVKSHIGGNVTIYPLEQIETEMNKRDGRIWIDSRTAACALENTARKAGLKIHDEKDPCIHPKSIKTAAEQVAIRAAHIKDGVALVKFIKWFEENAGSGTLSERSVEEKLEKFRREEKTYLGPSFSTIAGFNENGAIIHYRADEKSNKTITGDGLLLLDSGGQYRWATTDITRTLPVGRPSQEMRENYTRVLQGHIAVASAKFSAGTPARELDALARKPLRQAGLDYTHGTGHGVGCYLCVHESAANISWRGEEAPEPGMLLSNEPGYYKTGEYGIRLENLILFKPATQAMEEDIIESETITLCPFESAMVVSDMLTHQENEWLEKYNKKILLMLSPYLDKSEKRWLESKIGQN